MRHCGVVSLRIETPREQLATLLEHYDARGHLAA